MESAGDDEEGTNWNREELLTLELLEVIEQEAEKAERNATDIIVMHSIQMEIEGKRKLEERKGTEMNIDNYTEKLEENKGLHINMNDVRVENPKNAPVQMKVPLNERRMHAEFTSVMAESELLGKTRRGFEAEVFSAFTMFKGLKWLWVHGTWIKTQWNYVIK